jgi:hypothetical protein
MISTLTSRHLRTVGVLAGLAPAALGVAAAPAQAADATLAMCNSRFLTTITPGFTMTPGSGTFTTHGQTGSITCVGRIGGDRVTGPGSIGAEEAYTAGNCISHVGSGIVRIALPTTAGIKHMVGELAVRRTALVVRPEIRFPGARFSALGAVVPTRGDCFVTRQRQALVLVAGVIRGA